MDLTVINGLGPARRDKLETAGVDTLAALAKGDPEALAEETEIPEGVLDGFHNQAVDLVELSEVEGIDEDAFEALVDAGVRSVEDLAGADPSELATETELDPDTLEAWQDALATEETVEPEPETPQHAQALASEAQEAGRIALQGLADARVVLQEGIADATVKFEDDVLAQARILPIKAKDDMDRMLEDIRGDVVVLREKADTALVRIEDEVVEGLPIFKTKVSEAGASAAESMQEVRVRVQEIRDKRVLPEAEKITDKIKSLFTRS